MAPLPHILPDNLVIQPEPPERLSNYISGVIINRCSVADSFSDCIRMKTEIRRTVPDRFVVLRVRPIESGQAGEDQVGAGRGCVGTFRQDGDSHISSHCCYH